MTCELAICLLEREEHNLSFVLSNNLQFSVDLQFELHVLQFSEYEDCPWSI